MLSQIIFTHNVVFILIIKKKNDDLFDHVSFFLTDTYVSFYMNV